MADRTPLQRPWLLLRMLAGVRSRPLERSRDPGNRLLRYALLLDHPRRTGAAVREVGPHGKKFWRLQFDHGLPAPSFDYDELAAFYLGRRFLAPLAGTVFADSALAKMRAGLPDSALRYLEKLASTISHDIRQR